MKSLSVTPVSREQRRREIAHRDARGMALTVLRMLGYATALCVAITACGFLTFMVFS